MKDVVLTGSGDVGYSAIYLLSSVVSSSMIARQDPAGLDSEQHQTSGRLRLAISKSQGWKNFESRVTDQSLG